MVLDGVMVITACICLTVMHPGIGFTKVGWAAAKFHFANKKEKVRIHGVPVEGGESASGGEKVAGDMSEQERGDVEVQ